MPMQVLDIVAEIGASLPTPMSLMAICQWSDPDPHSAKSRPGTALDSGRLLRAYSVCQLAPIHAICAVFNSSGLHHFLRFQSCLQVRLATQESKLCIPKLHI